MAEVQASFQALTLATEVTVVNESGGWLVCSDIVSAATASPVPSPTASPTPAPHREPDASPPPRARRQPHREPDAGPHREPGAGRPPRARRQSRPRARRRPPPRALDAGPHREPDAGRDREPNAGPPASPVPVATAAELAAACDGSAVPRGRHGTRAGSTRSSWSTRGEPSRPTRMASTPGGRADAWPGPIQLVLCVEPAQHPVRVGTCGTYKRVTDGKVGQVNRFRYAQVVHVVVASTGKTLQSKTLYGKPPACGRKVALTSAPPPWRIYGGDVPDGAVNTYAAATSRQRVR